MRPMRPRGVLYSVSRGPILPTQTHRQRARIALRATMRVCTRHQRATNVPTGPCRQLEAKISQIAPVLSEPSSSPSLLSSPPLPLLFLPTPPLVLFHPPVPLPFLVHVLFPEISCARFALEARRLTSVPVGRGWSGPIGGPCSQCAQGKFKADSGAGDCIVCSPGEYQKATAQGSCDVCPKGSFQPSNGSSTCLSCPSGKAGTLTNATSEAVACPEYCTPGFYSAASTVSALYSWAYYASSHPTACTACGLHTYADRPMTGPICTYCPEHSSSPQGSINVTNCTCNRCYAWHAMIPL